MNVWTAVVSTNIYSTGVGCVVMIDDAAEGMVIDSLIDVKELSSLGV